MPPHRGRLYAPLTTPALIEDKSLTPGVIVVATTQPRGLPDAFQYIVTWELVGVRAQPSSITIDVPADGVVDLATVIPTAKVDGIITVVSHEDRLAAEAAADRAKWEADRAGEAVTKVEAEVVRGLSWTGAVDLAVLADAPRMIHATLAGNVALSLPTPPESRGAYTVTLVLTQGAGGNKTITIPAHVAFSVPIVLSTAAGSIDLVHLLWDGVRWWAMVGALKGGVA